MKLADLAKYFLQGFACHTAIAARPVTSGMAMKLATRKNTTASAAGTASLPLIYAHKKTRHERGQTA